MRLLVTSFSLFTVVMLLSGSIETADSQTCGMRVGAWEDGPVRAVDSRSEFLFVSAGPSLRIIDVSNPAQPVELSSLRVPGTIRDLSVDGDIVVAALGQRGIAVVDVSDPEAPVLRSRVTGGGFAEKVAASASRVAVAD